MPKGRLIWQKTLSKTDAQHQEGHPTGDLRLVQAKKDNNDEEIDQTSHFRQNVFGSQSWVVTKQSPLSEEAEVDFDVTIRGTHLGNRLLTVSHKPSGEAGQGNYTTNIRWGSLAETLRADDLTACVFKLYAPAEGTTTPFFIEID